MEFPYPTFNQESILCSILVQVRGAGSDCFFRNPLNLDENISVEMSSPSSSRYKVSVNDFVGVKSWWATEWISSTESTPCCPPERA